MVSGVITRSVMQHIMHNGYFIISDIIEDTGYSVTTVAKYVAQLIEDKIISEIDKVNLHSKGRKTVRYGVGAERYYFLGVNVAHFEISIALIDLSGHVVSEDRNHDFRFENSHDALDTICRYIIDFVNSTENVDMSMIKACNINLSGRVNSKKGTSGTIFNFEETTSTPLVDIVSEKLSIRVFIENDTKAMTYGEYYSGLNRTYKNMCFVNIGWGLGLGLIIDGKLYYGKDGYSGEFGHMYLYDNNILCHCGKKGCLETEVSGRAIVRKLTERISAGESSLLSAKVRSGKTITNSDILAAVEKEDALCIELVTEMGKELGRQLAGIVNILNPEVIVIGGSYSRIESCYFLQYIKLAIRQYSLRLMSQDVPVLTSSLGTDAAVIGACLIARSRTLMGETE